MVVVVESDEKLTHLWDMRLLESSGLNIKTITAPFLDSTIVANKKY